MECNKIENNIVFGSSIDKICFSTTKIGYTQVGDTNSLYTASKLYQVTCDKDHYETSGYYKVEGDDRWRYWDDTIGAFTQSGKCSEYQTTTTTMSPVKLNCWKRFINFIKEIIKKIIK